MSIMQQLNDTFVLMTFLLLFIKGVGNTDFDNTNIDSHSKLCLFYIHKTMIMQISRTNCIIINADIADLK